jgi:hypothetical protein
MKQELQQYVGRVVRLNQEAYLEVKAKALRKGQDIENSFIVAEVSRSMRKLICYGANFRIVVDVSDVVLV